MHCYVKLIICCVLSLHETPILHSSSFIKEIKLLQKSALKADKKKKIGERKVKMLH